MNQSCASQTDKHAENALEKEFLFVGKILLQLVRHTIQACKEAGVDDPTSEALDAFHVLILACVQVAADERPPED